MPNIFTCLLCCFSCLFSQSSDSSKFSKNVVNQTSFLSPEASGALLDDEENRLELSVERINEIRAWIGDVKNNDCVEPIPDDTTDWSSSDDVYRKCVPVVSNCFHPQSSAFRAHRRECNN